MFDMKPKLNTCLCYKKCNDYTFIPLIGTMFDCIAKQIGVPKGQFSPA